MSKSLRSARPVAQAISNFIRIQKHPYDDYKELLSMDLSELEKIRPEQVGLYTLEYAKQAVEEIDCSGKDREVMNDCYERYKLINRLYNKKKSEKDREKKEKEESRSRASTIRKMKINLGGNSTRRNRRKRKLKTRSRN